MPARRDESDPCTKCGGERKRSPKGSVYCVPCNKRYREENRARNQVRDRQYYRDNLDQYNEYRLNIPEDAPIYYPYNTMITLKEFSEQVGIPLIVCKYRYGRHPLNAEWILNNEWDNRFYEYRGIKYNATELSLMSGINYTTIRYRLRDGNKSMEEVLTP